MGVTETPDLSDIVVPDLDLPETPDLELDFRNLDLLDPSETPGNTTEIFGR